MLWGPVLGLLFGSGLCSCLGSIQSPWSCSKLLASLFLIKTVGFHFGRERGKQSHLMSSGREAISSLGRSVLFSSVPFS